MIYLELSFFLLPISCYVVFNTDSYAATRWR